MTEATLGRTATAAVLLMLAANFFFAVVDSSSKWLLTLGYAALQLAFFRYLSQLAITTALVVRKPQALAGLQPNLVKLILRASLLVVSTILNFVALQYLSLSVTSAIMFLAPVLVCALSWPLLGERVGPVRWSAVLIGFAGVLTVIRPLDADLNFAAFLMLGAAVGLALYSIMTRKMAGDIPPLAMQFVLGLTGTLALLPFAVAFWTWPETPGQLLLMLSLGCFAWFGHEMLIKAHHMAEANYLSPYAYSYLIYMTAAGYLLFNDIPDIWTVLGAAMIAAAGLLIWWREMRQARMPAA